MSTSPRVVREGSDSFARLRSEGWVVEHRSFGARLDADRLDLSWLQRLVDGAGRHGTIRALGADDVPAILRLDEATRADYPGGAATQHVPLTVESASPGPSRRAYGFFSPSCSLLAVTYVDLDADGERAETDFTVVHRDARRRGIGTAVKAASILDLVVAGVRVFRTGGSAENAGIIAANTVLGYVIDEHWVTLAEPAVAELLSSPALAVFEGVALATVWAEIAELFADCFAAAPYFEDPTELRKIVEWGPGMLAPDGRLVTARRDEVLVGFALGQTLSADDFYRESLARVVPREAVETVLASPDDALVIRELAVRESERGRGIARACTCELLAGRPERVTVLGTFEQATDARSMYERWGFEPLGAVPLPGRGTALHLMTARTDAILDRLS